MKNIISFSLWGNHPMYWTGALKNIRLAQTIYPGWVCRFYIDSSSPPDLINSIRDADCEAVLMEPAEPFAGLFWRFYAADDSDVMICRDADSRLSAREAEAVAHWLGTDRHFHIMRDNPLHNALILGGMWGCRNMKGMKDLIDQFPYKHKKGTDQHFLAYVVYPQIRELAVIHDSYNLFGDGIDFPSPRNGDAFVGDALDQHDVPVVLPNTKIT